MALTQDKMQHVETWKTVSFTLASGTKAFKGGIALLNTSTGKVVPGTTGTSYMLLGTFANSVDATGGDALVEVDLIDEIELRFFKSGTDAEAITTIGGLAYVIDDETVGAVSTGKTVAGRVLAVNSYGVGIAKLTTPVLSVALAGLLAPVTAAPAFVSNDCVIGANPVSGTTFTIPATAANSTVTLPATASEGCVIRFAADGTNNGHTVQYRDATGPANLTTALTASKRHLVQCAFAGGKWFANAYVSP